MSFSQHCRPIAVISTVCAGRYGVRSGFLLRVDCATGVPVGVVRDRN